MHGDINADNFRRLISGFNINCELVEFANYDDVFKAVSDKSVDAGVAGITYGMANGAKFNLKSTGVVFNPINLFFTVAKDKNADLLVVLDKYLAGWKDQDNSFYYQVKHKWMGGTLGVITETPKWLIYAMVGSGVFSMVAIIFIVLLKLQVRQAIKKIQSEAEELRKSDEKYEFLVDKMQEIAIIIDENGIIKFVNEYTCKILGYSKDEMIGKQILDFVLPEYHKLAFETIQKEFTGQAQPGFEAKVKNKNGGIKILKLSDASNPIKKDGKVFEILINAVDITEEKAAGKDLEESKKVLQMKVEELEKFQKLTVDRELKMAELKENIEKMKKK